MSASRCVNVALGARSYDILIGRDVLAAAGAHIVARLGQREVALVSDARVDALHGDRLVRALTDAGLSGTRMTVAPGEASKDYAHLQALLEALLGARIERGGVVVALGGGVIGDLAGLAASLLRRGVDLVQVPTTLLAQVDSSVGGKTGINCRHGKNLIGTFHQPCLVLADTAVLATLPVRELRAGYAEIVKYGLIDDPAFFAWLESEGARVLAGDHDALDYAIAHACAAKARIVRVDEREQGGARMLLNLGHTFAHALEAAQGYGARLVHGEAVAIGLVLAFALSARLGYCAAEDVARVRDHLARHGLPTGPGGAGQRRVDAETLLGHMAQDKKVKAGRPTFVLARGIGRAFVAPAVDPAAVRAVLSDALAAAA